MPKIGGFSLNQGEPGPGRMLDRDQAGADKSGRGRLRAYQADINPLLVVPVAGGDPAGMAYPDPSLEAAIPCRPGAAVRWEFHGIAEDQLRQVAYSRLLAQARLPNRLVRCQRAGKPE